MAPETPIRFEGVFWQIETPERQVRGVLELSDGADPALETEGAIFDELAYRITVSERGKTIAQSGNPDDLVADFQPRNINGQLSDGRRVSLVEAQGAADPNSFMGPQYRQRFRVVRHAVMDELVDGAAQRYAGFKFDVRGSGWWRRPDDDRVREIDRSGRELLTEADLEEFKQALNDAFAFVNEPTFRSRMTDLIEDAQSSIPNIAVNFSDWPAAVKDARNKLAHEGTGPGGDSEFVDLLIALSYSIHWVLRTVLLKQAGFDPPTLQAAYRDSSRYNHHITNTRYMLAGSPYAG